MRLTQRNKIILGLIAVAVIILIFFMTSRTKAKYAIPTTATGATGADLTFYNAYTQAQTEFAGRLKLDLYSSNAITGSGTTVTFNTPFPHPFVVGNNIIVGGVTGDGSTNFNSPINIGAAIPIQSITKTGSTVTVTTTSAHNLVNNFLVNIQGSTDGKFDTIPECSNVQNQTYSKCTQVAGVWVNPTPVNSAAAVTVTSPTVFTYTDPGITAPGVIPGTLGGGPGAVVPVSGVPTPFSVATVPNKYSFTYTALGPLGTGAITSNGWAFDISKSASMTAYQQKDATIGTAVSGWVNGKCPAFSQAQITDQGYTSNVGVITAAYESIVRAAFITNDPPIAVVNAARKADLTIPLRMYLASMCTGIYDGQMATKLTGFTSASIGPGGSAIDTNAITAENIKTWAKYAAVNPSAASAAATTPLLTGSTTWATTNVTDPLTGASLPAYQVAKNYGPGAAFSTGLTVATFKS